MSQNCLLGCCTPDSFSLTVKVPTPWPQAFSTVHYFFMLALPAGQTGLLMLSKSVSCICSQYFLLKMLFLCVCVTNSYLYDLQAPA